MDPFIPRPRPPRRRHRGEIPALYRLFLPEPEPYQRRRNDLPPWEDEVEQAAQAAAPWAREWFEVHEVAAWRAAWPQAQARIAAKFRQAGVGPEVAMTPLWYGRVNLARPGLAVRVASGDLAFEDALVQLREAGLIVV